MRSIPGVAALCVVGLAVAPAAHADPLDAIRGAVNGSRSQSTCSSPLAYNGTLEAAAQDLARREDAIMYLDKHGYQGDVRVNVVKNDPTSKATEEVVAQERDVIHDCSFTEFGVGMFRDDAADESWVTVAIGRPAAPPSPAAGPTYAPRAPEGAHVVGGDLAVFNIAHDDTPDPATGVRGVKIATLLEGTSVTFDGPCKNQWCRIKSPLIPGGFGFGAEQFIELD